MRTLELPRTTTRVEATMQELEAALERCAIGPAGKLRCEQSEDHVAEVAVKLTCFSG